MSGMLKKATNLRFDADMGTTGAVHGTIGGRPAVKFEVSTDRGDIPLAPVQHPV